MAEVNPLSEHPDHSIRTKVFMIIFAVWKNKPSMVTDMDMRMKKIICDKEPQVMATSLNAFVEKASDPVWLAQQDWLSHSVVTILKQIMEHRLGNELD